MNNSLVSCIHRISRRVAPAAAGVLSLLWPMALGASGDLDPSFSRNGLLTMRLGRWNSAAAAVQQPDGKLVLAGASVFDDNSDNSTEFVAVRVGEDGTPDTAFGTDGVARANFGPNEDYARAVIQQPDGKLVLAGNVGPSNGTFDIGITRLNADGTLDVTFGVNGWAVLDIGGSHDYANALVRQPDGKLVIAGGGIVASTNDYKPIFARFNTDGTLDASFAAGGVMILDNGISGAATLATALTQQPDGKFVAAVADLQSSTRDFVLVRLTGDGSLDPSFDGDGVLEVDIGGNDERAISVAIQTDGAILVAGSSAPPGPFRLRAALMRVNGDGGLDTAFGVGGQTIVELGDHSVLNSVVAQADGKIIALGDLWDLSRTPGQSADMILLRFNADGTLDKTHGIEGVTTVDFGMGDIPPRSGGSALIQQADGKHVAVGTIAAGAFFGAARFDDDAAFPGLVGFTLTSRLIDEPAGSISYTVRRTGGTTGPISVDYATTDGEAQAGWDFENAAGTLTWGDGEVADKTITVTFIDDVQPEPDEDLVLTLLSPTGGAQLAASEAPITIASDDGPGELGFVSAATVLTRSEDHENDIEHGYASVRVGRKSGWTGAVSVEYQTIAGTALAGTDFVSKSGILEWSDGDREDKFIVVTFIADKTREYVEEFTIQLGQPTGGAALPASGSIQRVQILDNDTGPAPPPPPPPLPSQPTNGGGGSTALDSILLLAVLNAMVIRRRRRIPPGH